MKYVFILFVLISMSVNSCSDNSTAPQDKTISGGKTTLAYWSATNQRVHYNWLSSSSVIVTLFEGFRNTGSAGYVNVKVPGSSLRSLFTEAGERFRLEIKCSASSGGSTTMKSYVYSEDDTLEIRSSFSARHISTQSVKITSYGGG
jgi:hypothetical protein